MIQFTEPRDVLLRNVNTRMEKHGEDDIPALDLAISVTAGNAILDMVHPDLRRHLFKPVTETPGELSLPVDDLPSVRFPLLKTPLNYDREWIGHTLKVHYGANGKADMVLGGVKVSKVQIESLIEGGSAELRFNLSTTDISEKVIGKLSLLQKHVISITLTPAEVAEDKPKEAWPFPDAPKGETQKSAEELFTDTAPPTTDNGVRDGTNRTTDGTIGQP